MSVCRVETNLAIKQSQSNYDNLRNVIDPSLSSLDYGSCLIIGRSGTGKSTLLKKLVGDWPKSQSLYLVNAKGAEIAEYSRGKSSEKIRLAKITGLERIEKKSMVILEDLIKLSPKESDSVRQLLNYTAHHKSSKIYCVTHTIFKTGIFSLLPLFHYIVFTSSPSNVPIARSVLNVFKVDKPLLTEWINLIKEGRHEGEGKYFFFDCTKMLFGISSRYLCRGGNEVLGSLVTGKEGQSLIENAANCKDNFWHPKVGSALEPEVQGERSEKAARMKSLFCEYFSSHPKKHQAGAIFSTISSGLGISKIDEHDLTVSFGSRTSARGEPKKISLVDYVSSLLDSGNKKPGQELRVLHKYIGKFCALPKTAIDNRYYHGREGAVFFAKPAHD
jgi:hypothetical protein